MLAHFRFVIFLAAMYLCGIVAAQGVDRGSDYYRSQYVRLHKAYLKDTNDVENLVNLSRFYSDERNPMFSLPFARGYLNRADSRYRFMLSGNEHDRELRRLINRGITLRSLDEAKKHLSRQAVLKLSSEELSLVEVDQFLEAFSDDKAVLKQAGIQRVKSAYRSVLRQNTIAAYVAFVKQYPGTDESHSAERHIAMLVDSLYDGSSDVSQADAYLKAYADCLGRHRREPALLGDPGCNLAVGHSLPVWDSQHNLADPLPEGAAAQSQRRCEVRHNPAEIQVQPPAGIPEHRKQALLMLRQERVRKVLLPVKPQPGQRLSVARHRNAPERRIVMPGIIHINIITYAKVFFAGPCWKSGQFSKLGWVQSVTLRLSIVYAAGGLLASLS